MKSSSSSKDSDLKTVLKNIEALLLWSRQCVNTVSCQLMETVAAIECATLSFKLQQLYKRWCIYLPFRESGDVDFNDWVKRFVNYRTSLNSAPSDKDDLKNLDFYPGDQYNLDFSLLLDDAEEIPTSLYAESEMKNDVAEYLDRYTSMMERIRLMDDNEAENWRERIDVESVDRLHKQYIDYLNIMYVSQAKLDSLSQEWVSNSNRFFEAITDQFSMCCCLDRALLDLTDDLRKIDQLLNGKIPPTLYRRLSIRLYNQHCSTGREDAQREVDHWCAEWPSRKLRERAVGKRASIISGLEQRFGDKSLGDYIDLDRPAPLTEPEFGQFLFTNRTSLTYKDVKDLFLDCYRIRRLNHVIDPTTPDDEKTAVPRLSPERQKVYMRLKELIKQANWQKGITPETMIANFDRMLNIRVDTATGGKDRPFTEADTNLLWKVLTKRRNKDEMGSLKLTWLNLVGYFLNRGALKGKGRVLCYEFFPEGTDEGRGNENDYNAVSKAERDEAFKGFERITAALDKMLGLTPPKDSTKNHQRK